MIVQVDFHISRNIIAMGQDEIVGQADAYVGILECRFKVPYSTDISRGY